MSTLSVATIKSQNTLPPAVQNSSGTEIGTFCRAWVNFNGTGTVAIRASFNVSSITDHGTGDYTVNMTTAMPDVNFGQVITALRTGSGNVYGAATYVVTTSSTRFSTRDATTFVLFDVENVNVAIFR
jgi:hypothetical protein